MILLLAAMVPLVIAPLVWRTSSYRDLIKWYALGALGNSLWILSYAGIDLAPSDTFALWATRSAWIGPIIGAPTFYLFSRSLTDRQPVSVRSQLLFFALSAAIHLPAVVGPAAVVSVHRQGSGFQWVYGPWAPVPTAFWITVLIASVHAIASRWTSLPWMHRNRVVLLLAGYMTSLSIGIVTSLLMPAVTGNHRYFQVGAMVSIVPFLIFSWILSEEMLPDFLGIIGRVFPNTRSRFLDALERFEASLSGFKSRESAINQLSALVGGRVVPLPAGTAGRHAFVQTGPWIAPEARERLYGRRDLNRIERIISKIDQQLKNAVRVEGVVITGWDTRSTINEPRRSIWPVGTVKSLRAAERAQLLLETEPTVLFVTEPDEIDTIFAGIRDQRLRPGIADVAYPDAADNGKAAAIELLDKCKNPREMLVFVRLAHMHRADDFDSVLAALVSDGVRLIVASSVPQDVLLQNAILSEPDLALRDMPRMDVPDSLRDPDEVSFLIDHYLIDIEARYHVNVVLDPEDRMKLCQTRWQSGREELRFHLERFALRAAGIVIRETPEAFA